MMMRLASQDEDSLIDMQNEALYALLWLKFKNNNVSCKKKLKTTRQFCFNNSARRPTESLCQPATNRTPVI